ncbi:hypothetical protein JCM8097_006444 [Rhodosporidiobolus ruineniae]
MTPTTAARAPELPAHATDVPAAPPQLAGDAEKQHRDEEEHNDEDDFEASPAHPRNWPASQRWTNCLVLALTGLLSTSGSSIFVPASSLVRDEYGVSQEIATLTTALFVLGLGAGPFFFAPISELYGRRPAYVLSMVGYVGMNLGCCFVKSLAGLIVLRFLAGFFGSSGPGLGVASVGDLFQPKERGRPVAIYAIGPMLGPVLGSIIGHYLVLPGLGTFRWPFRLMTILSGLNTLLIFFVVRESYAPVCERQWHAQRAAEEAGEGGLAKEERKMRAEKPSRAQAKEVVVRTFKRPPRMLLNPICALMSTCTTTPTSTQVSAASSSLPFAFASFAGSSCSLDLLFRLSSSLAQSMIYVFLVSFPLLYSRQDPPSGIFSYNWPESTSGLCYLGLGVGFLSAAATASTFADRIYKGLAKRYGNAGEPEYRLVLTQIGMLVFPLGLVIWAWTAQAETHWTGPVIGSAIFAFGLMLAFNSIQTWLVDAYSPYSAAAVAAATLLRSLTGTILPIFAPRLFVNLGYGWGGTLLALVTIPAVPVPILLFLVGGRLRERWKFRG